MLVAGFPRGFYFEKGASYYFHSVPFIAKPSLFEVICDQPGMTLLSLCRYWNLSVSDAISVDNSMHHIGDLPGKCCPIDVYRALRIFCGRNEILFRCKNCAEATGWHLMA